MSLRDQILAASDSKLTEVQVPEWSVTLYIRTMSGTERDAWEIEQYAYSAGSVELNRENIRARLLVKTLADDKGQRVFSDADVAALGGKAGDVVDRLYDLAKAQNGLTSKDVDDLAKNS